MDDKSRYPLMPKATAVYMVEETTLTFQQIANFCGIHKLEVQSIADNEVSIGIKGVDPISSGQLTKQELDRCSKDSNAVLQIKHSPAFEVPKKGKKKARYTPVARRGDKPDAIYWLIKNYPEIIDSTIVKLIGTTKTTIHAIRDRSHWNITNLRQRDPVLLGLCTQVDLDLAISKLD